MWRLIELVFVKFWFRRDISYALDYSGLTTRKGTYPP